MKSFSEYAKRLLFVRLGALATNILEAISGFGYNVVRKAADYTLTADDSGKTFLATAAVNFTLPTPAKGLHYTIGQIADANLAILSGGSADNIIAKNDAGADSVTFSTAGNKIGAYCHFVAVESAADTYKWAFFNWSDCTATIA